jgi:hypothetical protein
VALLAEEGFAAREYQVSRRYRASMEIIAARVERRR